MPSVRLHLAQARGEVRGGVLLSSAHIWERAYPVAPCRSTDIKQARPAYPFCTFLSPFPTGKGLGGQICRPIPEKCTGKKGNSGKRENPCIYWICRHRQEMHSSVFLSTDGNGTGNGNKKNPVKSRLPGYFCIYL